LARQQLAVTFSTAGNSSKRISFVSGLEESPLLSLPSQTQPFDQLMILSDIRTLEIIKKLPSTRDHLQQPATRIIVLLVYLEMLGQLVDPLRKQSDLNVRRPCVRVVALVIGNYLFF
jgi:hypothetical protein